MAAKAGYDRFGRSSEPIVFGHEFCGEVTEYGTGCRRRTSIGTPVVALPLLRGSSGVDALGFSVHAPGGYAEQTLVSDVAHAAVPNGLAPEVASLTEPMTVAWHAVRRGEVNKARWRSLSAAAGRAGRDPDAEGERCADYRGQRLLAGRRALATACGADVVVDPRKPPRSQRVGSIHLTNMSSALILRQAARRLGRLPFGGGTCSTLRGARRGPKHPYLECVGAPGVIESIIHGAPMFSRVVVVGMGVGVDQFTPFLADKRRSTCGSWAPTRRSSSATRSTCLRTESRPGPLITGTVGLDGVEGAFPRYGIPRRTRRSHRSQHHRARTAPPPPCGEAA